MELVLKNAQVFMGGALVRNDIRVRDGILCEAAPELSGERSLDLSGAVIFPGFADVHVHLREPGFSYKETVRTGTLAAAHGGYTAVCAMPNLNPAPDSLENLEKELEIIHQTAAVHVLPYGTITRGEKGEALSDMEALAPHVCAFTDDGRGVQSEDVMRSAMLRAKGLGKIIAAHCEDERLLPKGWSVHEGAAARLGLVGNPSESEWRQVQRDLNLVRETGAGYHVCHVSTKESVALIRQAKAEGLPVTCETAPHYLTLTDRDLRDEGRFRMNPPIRSEADREALLEAVRDGTVDILATDHAPHSAEEKARGLAGSLNGIVGLECAFPVLYTKLVLTNVLTLERLVELLTSGAKRFGLPGGELRVGAAADLTAFDLKRAFSIDSGTFLSMGRATPFEGWTCYGRCLLTLCEGRLMDWRDE